MFYIFIQPPAEENAEYRWDLLLPYSSSVCGKNERDREWGYISEHRSYAFCDIKNILDEFPISQNRIFYIKKKYTSCDLINLHVCDITKHSGLMVNMLTWSIPMEISLALYKNTRILFTDSGPKGHTKMFIYPTKKKKKKKKKRKRKKKKKKRNAYSKTYQFF